MPRRRSGAFELSHSSGPPTLKHIAQIAGLAVTTVSRALNDGPEISHATKERVRMVAKAIGYRANPSAVGLRTGRSTTIVLMHDIDASATGFSDRMIFGISEVLGSSPYKLMIMPQSREESLDALKELIVNKSACGILLSKIEPLDRRVSLLHESGLPFVTHGRTELGLSHSFHDFDNDAFAYDAVADLAKSGRRRIALLAPPRHQTYHLHVLSGFGRAIKDFDVAEFALPFTVEASEDAIREGIASIIRSGNRPDGIVVCSSSAAIAAMAGGVDAGVTLGLELDIVSKTYSKNGAWATPAIRWIYEDLHYAGTRLASLLIMAIEKAGQSSDSSIGQPLRLPDS